MNCDQAFELLTDPDNQAAAGWELDQHLASCPRCRSMSETLMPALTHLRTAATNLATAEELQWASAPPWRSGTVQPDQPTPRQPAPATRQKWLGWGLAFSAGLLLALLVQERDNPVSPMAPASTAACRWDEDHSLRPGEDASSVILSCVACHVTASGAHHR